MSNTEIRKRSGKKAVLPTIPQNTSELRQQVIEASGITIDKLSEQF